MKNKELFNLNPEEKNLKNEGVAKISAFKEKDDISLVEYELKTFVCEGEYLKGLKKIIEFYLSNFDNNEQPAFWVSGFYGSGKSHLVKMACYLWDDYKFDEISTARTIKPLPTEIASLFSALDKKQKDYGKLSIAGTLRDFPSLDIRYSFLQLFLSALDYPQQYHIFKFFHWLKKEKIFDQVKAIVENSGKSFNKELDNLFLSSIIAKSVLELKPDLAENEIKLRELFKSQFTPVESVSREEFVRTIKEDILPLSFGNNIPCTIIVLDEVQQFVGNDSNRAFDVQLLAEDLCSRFEGRFLLIGTGQNALTDTSNLQKLMARFRVPIQLTNTDIQTVIRKTILEKKSETIDYLSTKLDSCHGEISRNLDGTIFAFVNEDKDNLIADYPLLPSTRKFWHKVLQVIDVAGTTGQLRNQLRIIDDSLKSIAEQETGYVIPADFIFNQNQTQLIQTGLLSNEVFSLIQEKKSQGHDNELEGRILSVVFLLDQVIANIHDTRLKSDNKTIEDLLIDNLNLKTDIFRNKIKELIKKLVDNNILMQINDEFKLQTKIGAEWEKEYTKNYIKINNTEEDVINSFRKDKCFSFFTDISKGISIKQGTTAVLRNFEIWNNNSTPQENDTLYLWLKDEWLDTEHNASDESKKNIDKALAILFIPKKFDLELRTEILKFLASEKTLNYMGIPSSTEGQHAKKNIETRKDKAEKAISDLIKQICLETIIFINGEKFNEKLSLDEKLSTALNLLADKTFPYFKKADIVNWQEVLNRGLNGDNDALTAINFNLEIEKHPVSAEVLRFLSKNPSSGKDIRTKFMKAPYGWSQEAIDSIIILLNISQNISANQKNLKVNNLNQTIFTKETHLLTTKDKITIRKIFQEAGINCPPNQDLFLFSNEYLNKFKDLAEFITGEAPKISEVNTDFIYDIETKEGNVRLSEIVEQREYLQNLYNDLLEKAHLTEIRLPAWNLLCELLNHAPNSGDFEDIFIEKDLIFEERALCNQPDLIEPLLEKLREKLLKLLNEKKEEYNYIFEIKLNNLLANEYFAKLSPEQKYSIREKHQVLKNAEIKELEAHGLLSHLKIFSLYTWDTKIAALPRQFQLAIEDAIKFSVPQALTYSLSRQTIKNQEDIDEYIHNLKNDLESLIQKVNSIILE